MGDLCKYIICIDVYIDEIVGVVMIIIVSRYIYYFFFILSSDQRRSVGFHLKRDRAFDDVRRRHNKALLPWVITALLFMLFKILVDNCEVL